MRPRNKKVLLAALMVVLAGCGGKTGAESPAGPVAAKVNGEAIDAHSVEAQLAKVGLKDSAQSQEAANQMLNVLLEQRLLAQQARKSGLDKDAAVNDAVQAAERQVLAQAYIDKITVNAAKPTDAEVKDYYDKHPELFSERRIYRLQELQIQVNPENVGAVKARLSNGANLNELVEWLKSQNIPTRGAQSVKPAEQLPLELAARLHPLKDGQAITLENPRQFTVLAITGSQTQPLTLDQAHALIERFLLTMHKRDMAKADLDKLRAAAKIEYVAPYAQAKAANHVVSATKDEPAEPGMIEKALSGLK